MIVQKILTFFLTPLFCVQLFSFEIEDEMNRLYKPMNDDFGFSVIKTIDYRVGFFNDKEKPISEEILYDLLMLKCAEFTLEKNSKYFEIINLMYADNGKFISEIYNFIDLHETEPKNSENRVYKAKKVIEYLCSKHKIKRACGE